MPHMTVLLPALNAEETIGTAVSSTLRGMPKDARLYVLDDGSTDATAEKAREAGTRRGVVDKRLTVVSRPPSGSLANALTSMLPEVDSALIARMDADDISLPWRFRVSLPALDGRTDAVFTQVTRMNGKKLRPELPLGIGPEAFPVHLLLTNPVTHPSMIARREAIDAAGGFRDVPAEDYDLWIRMATHDARLRRLPHNSLICRAHPQQVTATAGWHRRSWTNPRQAEAFADLSEKLTGRRLRRIVAIAQLDPAEKETALRHFADTVTPLIDALPRRQQPLLRRRLRERLRWARATGPTPK